MNISSDILQQIVCKMDNESIRSLILPGIWNDLLLFISKQNFWYLRTQVLISRELSWEEGDWKEAYYILSQMKNGTYQLGRNAPACIPSRIDQSYRFYNKEDNSLLVNILISLGLDPSSNRNIAISICCDRGYLNLVKSLLRDSRIDPSAGCNYPIVRASQNGHIEIVKLLLQDPRVNPYAENCEALILASSKGRIEVVNLLMQDDVSRGSKMTRVDLNNAILEASTNGHWNVAGLLLKDNRVDPSIRGYVIVQLVASRLVDTESSLRIRKEVAEKILRE